MVEQLKALPDEFGTIETLFSGRRIKPPTEEMAPTETP